MVEDGKSLQKAQEQREIVIHDSHKDFVRLQGDSPLESLLEAQVRPPLEIVGFSPLLPQKLKDLNDAVVKRSSPRLAGVSIDFTPGESSLNVGTAYRGGMHISISSTSSREAKLNLEALDQRSRMPCRIEDIQGFVRSLFPEKDAKVYAAGALDSKDRRIDSLEDLDIDLYLISDDVLVSYLVFKRPMRNDSKGDVLPYENYFEVRIADQKFPLLVFHLDVSLSERFRPICLLSEVHYGRSTKEVEDAVDKVAALFKKPFNPFEEKKVLKSPNK